jgi:hypothetical protein
MEYEEFVRDFYVEPPELADLTPQEVDLLRAELENIKIAVCIIPCMDRVVGSTLSQARQKVVAVWASPSRVGCGAETGLR